MVLTATLAGSDCDGVIRVRSYFNAREVVRFFPVIAVQVTTLRIDFPPAAAARFPHSPPVQYPMNGNKNGWRSKSLKEIRYSMEFPINKENYGSQSTTIQSKKPNRFGEVGIGGDKEGSSAKIKMCSTFKLYRKQVKVA